MLTGLTILRFVGCEVAVFYRSCGGREFIRSFPESGHDCVGGVVTDWEGPRGRKQR